jgi:hypothetical protein
LECIIARVRDARFTQSSVFQAPGVSPESEIWGAVGKKTAIALAAIVTCGVGMVCGWGNELVILIAIGAVVLIVILAYRDINHTLKQFPDLALMDGTEIVALRKVELAAKNMTIVDVTPSIPDPKHPPRKELLAPEDEEEQ